MAFVFYVYTVEAEKRNWNLILAGLAFWGMDWFNEVWNCLVFHFTNYAPVWGAPGKTRFLILIGLNIEICFMFAVSGLIWTRCCSRTKNRILGIPNRAFIAVAGAAFCVFVEYLLNSVGPSPGIAADRSPAFGSGRPETAQSFREPRERLPGGVKAPQSPGGVAGLSRRAGRRSGGRKWRRRTMYLSSLILHGFLLLLLLFSPDLLRRGRMMIGLPVQVAPKKQYSFLLLPPEVLRKLTEPPPENSPLSDRDRRAQGRSPVINPRGLSMPYSRGNTPLPEIAGGQPPAAPPTPPPAAGGNAAPAAPGPPANQQPNPEPQNQVAKNDGLRLEDAKPPSGGGGAGLILPNLTPGQAIQQSLQSAAHGRSAGGGVGSSSGYGEGNGQFQNLEPNFSTEGPLILSDTRGVDFGPYLARVVYAVRRNWYSVIPESARLGEKGRVGIVFEILKDGSVPQLRLVASSGSDPLDRAALHRHPRLCSLPALARRVHRQPPGSAVYFPLQPFAWPVIRR